MCFKEIGLRAHNMMFNRFRLNSHQHNWATYITILMSTRILTMTNTEYDINISYKNHEENGSRCNLKLQNFFPLIANVLCIL